MSLSACERLRLKICIWELWYSPMAEAQKAGKKELLWRIFNGQMEQEVTAKASKNKQPEKETERDGLKAKSLNLVILAIKTSWGTG